MLKKAIVIASILLLCAGCSYKSVTLVDGTRVPLSDLSQKTRYIDEPMLVLMQVQAEMLTGIEHCKPFDSETRVALNKVSELIDKELNDWVFPRLSETNRQDWNIMSEALVEHYSGEPREDFCIYIKDQLKVVR